MNGGDEGGDGDTTGVDGEDESEASSGSAELDSRESSESADDEADVNADGVSDFTTGAGLVLGDGGLSRVALSSRYIRRTRSVSEVPPWGLFQGLTSINEQFARVEAIGF